MPTNKFQQSSLEWNFGHVRKMVQPELPSDHFNIKYTIYCLQVLALHMTLAHGILTHEVCKDQNLTPRNWAKMSDVHVR